METRLMKKLNVAITQAQLTGFIVEMNAEGGLDVSATIVLLMSQGKQVSTHTISTSTWRDENKFELPYGAIPAIQTIAKSLEQVVVQKYQDTFLALPAPQI